MSREIFNQNSWTGTASLLWYHSYYHTGTFERILKTHIGEIPLISLARDPDLPRVSTNWIFTVFSIWKLHVSIYFILNIHTFYHFTFYVIRILLLQFS